MGTLTLCYRDLGITVEAEDTRLIDLMASYHDFLIPNSRRDMRAWIRISIESRKRFDNEFFGLVSVDERAVMKRMSARRMADVTIDPRTNDVSAVAPMTGDVPVEALFETVLMQPLKYLAKKYGIFFVHASAVALKNGTGIMFIGDQHAGKSTLALAMLLAGASYVAEESPAVAFPDGAPVLCGFPEPIGVSECSLANFPVLRTYCRATTAPYLKHRVRFSDIRPGGITRECRPAAIFLPRYTGRGTLDMREVGASEALAEILSLELEVRDDEFNRTLSQAHMAALGALVSHVRCWRIEYDDTRLSEIPGLIATVLAGQPS